MKNTVHRLMGCLLAILPVLCGAQSKGFTNPLLPSGADPFVVYHQGYYYYTHTLGNRIQLWKTQHISRLGNAVSKTVWTAPQEGPDSRDLWAPELHRFNNKWYLYYTATDKARPADSTRFIFVLENEAADPLEGNWVRKGKVNTAYSGLDATVFTWKAQPYFAYSAYVGKQSVLCLAAMSNPWTLTGKETIIARPDRPWEKFGGREILEAPAFLEGKKGQLLLVYSASACWADEYALGMLEAAKDADILDAASWKKHPQPVFRQSAQNSVFATGHNAFFTSPDGKENWLLYHANAKAGEGCNWHRSPRAQPFGWHADGTPDFGEPVPAGKVLSEPSGEAPEETSAAVTDSAVQWTATALVNDIPAFNQSPAAKGSKETARDHGHYGSEYGRMVQLPDGSWIAAYTVSRNAGYLKDPSGGLEIQVSYSTDHARTWKPVSILTDKGRDLDNAQLVYLKDGSLLLACRSVRWRESYRLPVYRSTDKGLHWTLYSTIDANEGKPGELGQPDKGIYEPHMYLLDDGRLAVLYANEKHVVETPSYSQVISQKISEDLGHTWGPESLAVYTPGNAASRPGMPVWTKMTNGSYIMVYEVCGPEKCHVYYKISRDGMHWPEGLGNAIPGQLGGPYVLSCSNGLLVVSSNSAVISLSHDWGTHWTQAPKAWPQLLWSSIYQTGAHEIAVMNSVARPGGGHNIQLRFGQLKN
jgi:GH43 family beta-xylosidase